jgi:hypothetical protein
MQYLWNSLKRHEQYQEFISKIDFIILLKVFIQLDFCEMWSILIEIVSISGVLYDYCSQQLQMAHIYFSF